MAKGTFNNPMTRKLEEQAKEQAKKQDKSDNKNSNPLSQGRGPIRVDEDKKSDSKSNSNTKPKSNTEAKNEEKTKPKERTTPSGTDIQLTDAQWDVLLGKKDEEIAKKTESFREKQKKREEEKRKKREEEKAKGITPSSKKNEKTAKDKYWDEHMELGRVNPNEVLLMGKGPVKIDKLSIRKDNFQTKTNLGERAGLDLVDKAVNNYVSVVEREHTFTEEENARKAIDDSILQFKEVSPEGYEKHRQAIDYSVKYALDKDYRAGVRGHNNLGFSVQKYAESTEKGDTKSAEAAKQAAWADVQNIKKNAPKYYAENAAEILRNYSQVFDSETAKKNIDQDVNAIAFAGDDFTISWLEIYNNAVVRELEAGAKKASDFDDIVKAGWEFGSSEAMEKSGIKARGSVTPEKDTDMQRFGNPLVYIFDPARKLSGTSYEKEFGASYDQTEAEYFGRQGAFKDGFFDGLIANGDGHNDKHNLALYMTDDEKNVFTYLYMKDIENGIVNYSDSTAKKYFDSLTPTLNQRITTDVSNQAKGLNIGAGAALRVFNNLADSAAMGRVAAAQLSQNPVDKNSQMFLGTNMNKAMQEEWFKDLNGTERFFAGIGLSIYDNLTARLITANTKMPAVLLPAQAFTSAAQDSAEKGITNGKAFGLSATLALSEAITETIKFDSLDKAAKTAKVAFLHSDGIKSIAKAGLKTLGVEGASGTIEETANEIVAITAEMIFSGKHARIRERYTEYKSKNGEDKANAVFSVVLSLLQDLSSTAISGFISESMMGMSKTVDDASAANKMIKSANKAKFTADIGKSFNNPDDVANIIKKSKNSGNDLVEALGSHLGETVKKLDESRYIANKIGGENYATGILDSADEQQMFDLGLLARAVESQKASEVYKKLSSENSDIQSAAELALENAIADVAKTNSTESGKLEATKADTAKRTIPLDDKKPKVTVATKDGGSVTVNGREFVTINGRGIYIVDGSQLGASQKYYAVDSSTGKAIAASDTNKKLTNAVYDFKAEMEKADSYIKDDIDSFEEYIDVASDIAVDRADTVVETADSNGDVAVAEIDSPVAVDETAKKSGDGGKKTTVTLISKDGLKTYEGVSVAEDTGYELTAVERNGGITIVENRSGMEFAHGATVQEAIAKVRNTIEKNGNDAVDAAIEKAIERRKASVDTSAGSTSPIEGDRLSVGRAVADADYTNTLLEMAKTSKNENARKAAELYSSYDFKDDNERYRALGDIAKMLGVSEADLVKSRAKSLFAKIRASISSETDVVDKTNAKIYEERQAAVSRGDTATVKALDYLTNLLNSEGSIISVSEMFAPNQYSAENPNVAVQVYGKRMEAAFKNVGLDISVSVYYDSSENAARGEWIKHPDGHSEIKLNGAKLQGEQSAFWVVSHELIHEAESKSPGITQRMLDAFTKMGMYDGSQYEAYKARYSKKCEADFKKALDRGDVTQDDHDEFVRNYVNEEIVADLMSETMSSSELVEVFAGKLGKDDANVIVSFLKKLLNGVKKVFNSKDEFPNKFSDIIGMFEGAVKGTDTKSSDTEVTKESFSSIGAAFYGNEKMTANEMERMLNDGSWKESEGYKKYLDDCVNVYKQAYGKATKSDIAQIEKEIEGIMRVAVAAKKAGYDILDNGAKRSTKDSKNRLLFSSLEPNSDYITSSDISAICDKRKTFTEIYDEIVRIEEANNVAPDERFFSKVDNYFILHKKMAEKGLVVPCEECYVESMRKNLAPMANAFITLVKETNAENKKNAQLYNQSGKNKGKLKENNAKIREKVIEICAKSNGTQEQIDKLKNLSADELAKFIDDVGSAENLGVSLDELTLPMLTTAEGLAKLKLRSPLLYEAFNSFYGQSKPKMPKEATPFRPGELIALFTDKNNNINQSLINKVKSTGGFRLQSYSDFQIGNFVDVLQTIFEASMLGLNGHAYTKVPAFLDATNGTNLKRNLSIFMYEDGGKWMLDKKNSFPMELDDIYALVAEDESGNTSIIAVSQNAKMSAWIMANDLVGYGIPFHKSGLKMDIVRLRDVVTPDGRTIKGYSNQIDHTKQQSEVYKYDKDGKKKNSKVSKPIDIYSFWDFENKEGLSKNELIEKNLKAYIDECEKAGYRPKFRDYVMNNDKVLKDVLAYSKELGFVSEDATIDDISFEYGEYRIPYGYYKFLGDFGMFTPEGEASPIKPLSLAEYDFDKAVGFFDDAKALREKELLQQFENGKVREEYRQLLKEGKITFEELQAVLEGKKNEVVQEVVERRFALTGNMVGGVPTYTDQEYRDFGWARENDIITAGENDNYRSKFAMLKSGLEKYRKTKRGEYIIPAYDQNDPELENINSVLVFAKGTIDKPIITSIIRIYSYNELEIDKIRRYIYDCERRGVQPKTGELFDRYDAADFAVRPQISASSSGYSSGDGLYRSGSNSKNNGTDKQRINYIDTEYLELAKNPEKNEARLREMVEEAAKKAMPKSLVVDKNGNLLKVYHGSAKKFTEFLHKYLNAHGNSHGRGFYFTENKALAEGYAKEDGQLLEGYLNIEKPLSEDKVTIKKSDLVKLIKATCEAEAKTLAEEGYSNISEALRDTWVSNYTNAYSANSMADVYREVADIVYSGNDNDVEIISELTNAGAGNESVLTLTRDILGYDGVIYTNDLGYHEYVALVSNQFKSADPVTYDNNGNVIPISERFNLDKKDTRYSLDDTGVYSLEDAWSEMTKKYGAIPKGETVYRDTDMSKNTTSRAFKPGAFSQKSVDSESAVDDVSEKTEPTVEDLYGEETLDDSYFYAEGDKRFVKDDEYPEMWETTKNNYNQNQKNVKVRSPQEIVSMIQKLYIPVYIGHQRMSQDQSAAYEEFREVLVTKSANNLPAIFHDLGHHLDKLYDMTKLEGFSEVAKEYSKGLEESYSAEEIPHEAAAEFVRHFLMNNDEMLKKFPTFTKAFSKAVGGKMRGITKIANAANAYMSASEMQRLNVATVSREDSEKMHKKYDGVMNAGSDLESKILTFLVDVRYPIDKVFRKAGIKFKDNDSPYRAALETLNSTAISSKMISGEGFYQHGATSESGKGLVRSLTSNGIKTQADIDALNDYLTAKHAVEWIQKGKRVFADDKMNTVEAQKQLADKLEKERPYLANAAKAIYEYRDNVIKYGIEAGIFDKDTMDTMRGMYPAYVPFWRDHDYSKNVSLLKHAKGSGRAILSPIENLMVMTKMTVSQSLYNRMNLAFADAIDTNEKTTHIARNVTPSMKKMEFSSQETKEKLSNALKAVSGGNFDIENFETVFNETIGEKMEFYAKNPAANSKNHIITVMRDGIPYYYQVRNADVYNALTRRFDESHRDIIAKIGDFEKKLFTDWSPTFLPKNAFRDIRQAYARSTTSNPFKYLYNYFSAFVETRFKSKGFKAYLAQGGGYSSMVESSEKSVKKLVKKDKSRADIERRKELKKAFADQIREARRSGDDSKVQELKKQQKQELPPAHMILRGAKFVGDVLNLSELQQAIEQAPRYAEFKISRKAGQSVETAIYKSKNVTTMFGRKGTVTPTLNKWVIFSNAMLQSTYEGYRILAGYENDITPHARTKHIITQTTLGILATAFTYFMCCKDDEDREDYEKLSAYMKYSHYVFPIGDGKFVRLPKANQNAIIDTLLTHAMLEKLGMVKPEERIALVEYLLGEFNPGFLIENIDGMTAESFLERTALAVTANIPIIGTATELLTNKDFLYNPIVPEYMSDWLPEEQYYESTSEIAKKIGAVLKVSPLKVDSVIEGLGVVGDLEDVISGMFVDGVDSKDVNKYIDKAIDGLLEGAAQPFTTDNTYSNDLFNLIYDKRDEAQTKFDRDPSGENKLELQYYSSLASYISKRKSAIRDLPEDEQRAATRELLDEVYLKYHSYVPTKEDTATAEIYDKIEDEDLKNKLFKDNVPKTYVTKSYNIGPFKSIKVTEELSQEDYTKVCEDIEVAEEILKMYFFKGGAKGETDEKLSKILSDYSDEMIKDMTDEEKVSAYLAALDDVTDLYIDDYRDKYIPEDDGLVKAYQQNIELGNFPDKKAAELCLSIYERTKDNRVLKAYEQDAKLERTVKGKKYEYKMTAPQKEDIQNEMTKSEAYVAMIVFGTDSEYNDYISRLKSSGEYDSDWAKDVRGVVGRKSRGKNDTDNVEVYYDMTYKIRSVIRDRHKDKYLPAKAK